MDQVFRSAAGATENGRRSTLAYDGHGRVFTVGEDGLLRSANVRSDFLVGAAARPRAPSKSGGGFGSSGVRQLSVGMSCSHPFSGKTASHSKR